MTRRDLLISLLRSPTLLLQGYPYDQPAPPPQCTVEEQIEELRYLSYIAAFRVGNHEKRIVELELCAGDCRIVEPAKGDV